MAKSKTITRDHNRSPIDWTSVYEVRTLLQDEITSSMRKGTKLALIAAKCNLSTKTVSKIGYGETKEPRASTILNLLQYFGYRITIQ